jgi:microcystin-dependent protein
MSDPFLGQLVLVPYNFAPRGWAFCNGQLLAINQNQALFALIGPAFGGDGRTNFALPDLRGRVPLSSGQGPALENYTLGQTGGAEHVALTAAQMPAHAHTLNVHAGRPDQSNPTGHMLASGSVYSDKPPNAAASDSSIGPAGSGQPHENRPPFLTLNWIIALEGIFPSRP